MIGIFDSGVGGLTVVKAFAEQFPEYDMVYFGDTARTPYGTKSSATVISYALQDTEFLLQNGAKLIVMACNTASSVATESIRETFDVPVFEVITPAAELAVRHSEKCRIGIIGTRATVNSGVYEKKIKAIHPDAKVYAAACPLLVPLVEEGWLKKPETAMIVKKYLHPLKSRQIDTLILGCTHYPILKKMIQQKIGRRVRVIDSSVAMADKVRRFLNTHPDMEAQMQKNNHSQFFVSDVTEQFKKIARTILRRNICLKHVRIES